MYEPVVHRGTGLLYVRDVQCAVSKRPAAHGHIPSLVVSGLIRNLDAEPRLVSLEEAKRDH